MGRFIKPDMGKYLYEAFRQWEDFNNIFIISDTHFSDSEEFRENYPGDEEFVKKINSKVGKNDALIILGDIGNIDFVKKIRGYKILLTGNHDKGISNYRREYKHDMITANNEDQIAELRKQRYNTFIDWDGNTTMIRETNNGLFDEIYDGPLMISKKVMLSHEPIDVPEYIFNIHGHDHGNTMLIDDHHLNVCAELIDYTPINLLNMYKTGTFKHIKDIHRMEIDKRKYNNER